VRRAKLPRDHCCMKCAPSQLMPPLLFTATPLRHQALCLTQHCIRRTIPHLGIISGTGRRDLDRIKYPNTLPRSMWASSRRNMCCSGTVLWNLTKSWAFLGILGSQLQAPLIQSTKYISRRLSISLQFLYLHCLPSTSSSKPFFHLFFCRSVSDHEGKLICRNG
jgi:hypothetical protein